MSVIKTATKFEVEYITPYRVRLPFHESGGKDSEFELYGEEWYITLDGLAGSLFVMLSDHSYYDDYGLRTNHRELEGILYRGYDENGKYCIQFVDNPNLVSLVEEELRYRWNE